MMGKVKEFMRSLCARLSKTSDGVAKSNESSFLSSYARTSMDSGSISTIKTQSTACSELQMITTTPLVSNEPLCSVIAALDRTLSNFVHVKDPVNGNTVRLNAHAPLEINVAMLHFVERLPLDELQVVDRGSTLSLFRKDNDVTTSDSSWSFACCSARELERDHTERRCEHDGSVAHEQLDRMSSEIAEEPLANSETLNLTSEENDMKSSSVSRSARQTAQGCTQRKRDNEANPFGGFAGPIDRDKVALWLIQQENINMKAEPHIPDQQISAGVTDSAFPSGHNFAWPPAHMECASSFTKRSIDSCDLFLGSIGLSVPTDSHRTTSDEDLDNLPNWSDVEDDPEYNVFEKRQFQRSRSASACLSESPTNLGDATTENVHSMRPSIMTDEEFEALPDWSDVEDDPEYNEFEKRSSTHSSSSSDSAEGIPSLRFPAVYIPSGYPAVAASSEVVSKTKPDHGGASTGGSWETEQPTRS